VGISSITKIPGIMRANKWFNGAALMDEWFAGPPTSPATYTTPDTTTIKMDSWVLTFPRAKTVFDSMVRDKVWKSDKAKPVFASRLRLLGVGPNTSKCMDISSKSTVDQHPLQVNVKAVPMSTIALDDMDAALGHFSIYVVPLVFDVAPEVGKLRVTLYSVGFHVWDSYDFEGHEILGWWDEITNIGSSLPGIPGTTEADNGDFRDWRTANGKGGDFLVYSDVKQVTISPPDSFVV
jgi:hypothetical protein